MTQTRVSCASYTIRPRFHCPLQDVAADMIGYVIAGYITFNARRRPYGVRYCHRRGQNGE